MPGRRTLATPERRLVYKLFLFITAAMFVAIILLAVVAPATPDDTVLNDLGEDVLDSMSAWFGQPFGAE